MGSYLPLFSLEVEHSFFSDGLCRELDFVPSPKTDRVIKKTGLLTRSTINGIRLFYDEHQSESLKLYVADPDAPLSLRFKVFSRDPFFENYTGLPSHKADAMLYCDNREAAIDPTGKFRLHDEEYISEKDFYDLNSSQIEHILSKKDQIVRPVFIVNIIIADKDGRLFDEPSKSKAKSYYLRFKARQTYWKYYLLGNLAREDLSIADLKNEIEFEFVGQESLPDNRIALTFRSKTTIPLQEKSDCRFQLRDSNSGVRKVLINRLPVASASQINRAIIDGEKSLVSEMFINC